MSPTSSATASTRASSCRATASGWPRARRPSTPLREALEGPPTLVDALLDEISRRAGRRASARSRRADRALPRQRLRRVPHRARLKRGRAATRVALGGGYVNTELRQLADPRVFDYVDYVTLDDGERPLLALIEHLADPRRPLLRTFVRDGGRVVERSDAERCTTSRCATAGTPTYDGLPLDRYLSLVEMLNPMHRLWSSGRWNKLTIAHGCYWKKCSFCDITLDYIARYDLGARPTCSSIASRRSSPRPGQTGFHFVDEAAPPAGPARARRAADRAQGRVHLVGQHPLREDLHAQAGARCWRARAASRCRAASRSPPIGCSSACRRA